MYSHDITEKLFFITFFAIGLIMSIITHELGHFICGRLSGYQFISFRLMKWLWTKDDTGKIKFTKSTGLCGILGQCLMEPCEDEKNFRFLLYNAGGGVVNLMFGTAFMIPFCLHS